MPEDSRGRQGRRAPTGLDIEPVALTGVYKNMPRGIIALVFRCKITGGDLATTDETAGYRWATGDEVRGLAEDAYAIRVLDAVQGDHAPAVREHDGVKVL